MYDEIIEIYFDYWINEHMYRNVLEKDEYYNDRCKEIKKVNKLLEKIYHKKRKGMY
ncbi:hypothetical protein [Clostridioides difficile]|uniref:hypothetical protein n=1 Tax=Clostridioides difficile TaxID=1496 RepID=UPI001F1FA487|nr:hypothetical protein [Clostridioides difficile]